MAIRHNKKTRTLAAFLFMDRVVDRLWKQMPYTPERYQSPEYAAYKIAFVALDKLANDLGAESYTQSRWNVFSE